jgi:hypothetical protein
MNQPLSTGPTTSQPKPPPMNMLLPKTSPKIDNIDLKFDLEGVNVYSIIIVLCISIDNSIIRTISPRNTHSQETQHLFCETL